MKCHTRSGSTRFDRASARALGRITRLLLAAFALPAAATSITVDTDRHADTIDIRASANLRANPAATWRVLTDYDRYPEFIPDLRTSRVIARRGATVTVEQSGSATLWLLKIPVEITFEITETPPYELRSRAIAGSLRAISSTYALKPTALGTRLEYVGRVAPGFELFAAIEEAAVRQSISRQFQALVDEIEQQTASEGGASRVP